MKRNPKLTVYYDGSCALCRAEIGHYSACDGSDQVDFEDVAQPDATPGEDLDRTAAMARFHVRRANGSLVSGARAFVALWETLPRWRWLARIAGLPGIIHVLELGYRGFLPVRPYLSRAVGRLSRIRQGT